jgi:hypothetical protein
MSSLPAKPEKKDAQRASGSSRPEARSARCAAPIAGAMGTGESPLRMSPASESIPIARIVHPPRPSLVVRISELQGSHPARKCSRDDVTLSHVLK